MAYSDPHDPRLKQKRREHYYANKEVYKERARAREAEMRKYVVDKKRVPCYDCGVQYNPWVMDFDHRDPTEKVGGIGPLIKRGSWDLLLAELEKCDVVCANCHRERTAKMFGWKLDSLPDDVLD